MFEFIFILGSTTDDNGCALGHPAVRWRGVNTHPSNLMVQLQGQEPFPE